MPDQASPPHTIKSMAYHGPGWTLDLDDQDGDGPGYRLWAPQEKAPEGAITNGEPTPARRHWAASWSSADGKAGEFVKGATAVDVLRVFPPPTRRKFLAVIAASDLAREGTGR